MLRRENDISHAEQGIGTCCEDFDFLFQIFNLELDQCPLTFPYPISLLGFYFRQVIDEVEVFVESVSIFRYGQHPLLFFALFDGRAAALAFAVDDFFVCKTDQDLLDTS